MALIMVTKELLEKFKTLYQEQFNISLTDEDATKMATDLVNLMRVLLKPEPPLSSEKTHQEERRQYEIVGARQY
jgi:hypothetical protein